MSLKQEAGEIILTLEKGGFYAECPCCGEQIQLKDASLFYLDDFSPAAFELYQQHLEGLKERNKEIRDRRKSISQKSEIGATAVNIGFILERIAPSLEDFRFSRNDCRALFDPIDYVIFEGLSSHGRVKKIRFVDIKTGKANLTSRQKEIRGLVQNRKIEWSTYHKWQKGTQT
jgi:predicted Holliday junction resolvase-like endonuclease